MNVVFFSIRLARLAGPLALALLGVLAIGWMAFGTIDTAPEARATDALPVLVRALAAEVEVDPPEGLRLRAMPANPLFSPARRDVYWEIEGSSGERLVSDSLRTHAFLLLQSGGDGSAPQVRAMVAPNGRALVGIEERVRPRTPAGPSGGTVRIAVALEPRALASGHRGTSRIAFAAALLGFGLLALGLVWAVVLARQTQRRR